MYTQHTQCIQEVFTVYCYSSFFAYFSYIKIYEKVYLISLKIHKVLFGYICDIDLANASMKLQSKEGNFSLPKLHISYISYNSYVGFMNWHYTGVIRRYMPYTVDFMNCAVRGWSKRLYIAAAAIKIVTCPTFRSLAAFSRSTGWTRHWRQRWRQRWPREARDTVGCDGGAFGGETGCRRLTEGKTWIGAKRQSSRINLLTTSALLQHLSSFLLSILSSILPSILSSILRSILPSILHSSEKKGKNFFVSLSRLKAICKNKYC